MADDDLTVEAFEALASDLEPPENPDEELDLVDDEEQPFEVAEGPTVPPLGRTPAFDFVQQTLMPSAAGGPLMLYGVDALAQWIEKALITPKGAAPACHEDFGIESVNHLITGGPFDASAVAELEQMVTDALTVHPRIIGVEGFEADHVEGDDAVTVSFRVLYQGEDDLEEQALSFTDFPIPVGEEAQVAA